MPSPVCLNLLLPLLFRLGSRPLLQSRLPLPFLIESPPFRKFLLTFGSVGLQFSTFQLEIARSAGRVGPEQDFAEVAAMTRVSQWMASLIMVAALACALMVEVADATAGSPPPKAIREAQELLAKLGYAPGPVNGIWGRSSIQAYRAFLRDQGRPLSDTLTPRALRAMRRSVKRHGNAVSAPEAPPASEEARQDPGPRTPRPTRPPPDALEQQRRFIKPFGPKWVVVQNQPCQICSRIPGAVRTATWSGGCVDGKASGEGRLALRNADTLVYEYQGQMRDGRRNGRGAVTYADGNRYDGEWQDGRIHGLGTYTWANGERYEGQAK